MLTIPMPTNDFVKLIKAEKLSEFVVYSLSIIAIFINIKLLIEIKQ